MVNPEHQEESSGSSPLSILREAIKAVPAVRFALGVAGIAAAIALVAGFLDLRIALIGIPIVFVFMVILVIFSKLADLTPSIRYAISALVVFSTVFFAAATVLFAVTFFVRQDVLHSWGLNSFYELINVTTQNSGQSLR